MTENNQLKVTFFDADKQLAPLPFPRATVRMVYTARDDHRVVLHPEGSALVSPRTVRPPHVFRVFLSLMTDGAAAAGERYTFSYPN